VSAHECSFPEEREPSGRLILGPCLRCGTSAMDALADTIAKAGRLRLALRALLEACDPDGCTDLALARSHARSVLRDTAA
jgi:hypothetical protein